MTNEELIGALRFHASQDCPEGLSSKHACDLAADRIQELIDAVEYLNLQLASMPYTPTKTPYYDYIRGKKK